MKLIGTLRKDAKIVRQAEVEKGLEDAKFRDVLEACLISLCKELDIGVPLWLKKNTTEFSAFRRTFFSKEQFLEKVWFDTFEIKLE